MDRRRAIAWAGALGVGLCAWRIASAQRQIRRIGFLQPDSADTGTTREFLRAMRELGYVDGQNAVIEARFADGRFDRLSMLAKELVMAKVEVIAAGSTTGVRAARQATSVIPIVMIGVNDPVGSGLVASLARPGGNVTGHSILAQDTTPKLLEMLRVILPKLSRVAVLTNPGNVSHPVVWKSLHSAAMQVGVRSTRVEVRTLTEIESAMATMARDRPDALVAPADPLFNVHAPQIAELALRHRLPSAFSLRQIVEAGGLMSYGADLEDSFRRGAVFVDKILRGAKPADLPVEQITKVEMVVNKKTAAALGLTVPPELLLRADRVIE